MGETERVERVRDALRNVYDPELGLDIVAMGLVYDVREDDEVIVVDMTLTTPGCPVSDSLPQEAYAAAAGAVGPGGVVDVNVVWDPPWTPEMLTDEAMGQLGFAPR